MSVIITIEGLPVINAKKPIVLHITPEDVSTARKHSPGNCAVAKACTRQLQAQEVRVHLSRIYVRLNEINWVRYVTPSNLRNEIITYDRGGSFEPAVFVLPAPSPARTTGKRQGSSTNDNRKNKKKRKAYTPVKGVRVAAHK